MAQPVPFATVKAYAAFSIEASPGTAEPTPVFDMRLRDIELSTELASYLLSYASGDHSVAGAVMGQATGAINFKVDTRCGSAAGTAPKWMKAAMFSGHRQEARCAFSGPIVTSNSIAGNVIVNGTPTAIAAQVFTTDSATTLTAWGAKIVTAGGAGTVVTISGNTVTVRHPTKVIGLSSVVVTLGASQATAALSTAICEDGTTDFCTATGYFYLVPPSGNAILVTIKGMRGSPMIGFAKTGEPIVYGVSGAQGGLVSITDAAGIVLTGDDTTDVPSTLGITLTDGATGVYVGSMQIEGGHDIQVLDSGQDATGIFAAHSAAKAMRLKWDPQVDLLAALPSYTRWKAGTKTAVAFVGPVLSGQKISINIPKVQILTSKRGSRKGSDTWEQESLIVKDPFVPAYEVIVGA